MSPAGRAESLRHLEQEVGVLIRRIRRVIAERALLVHEDLQPAAYLMLGYVAEHGPLRASSMSEIFAIDKGAISRQVQHLVDLHLVGRVTDPDDGRASLVSATDEAVRRLEAVGEERRRWLDDRLGDWSDERLAAFARELGHYNAALNPPS
ncbi:MarR family transcriptional regulator [Nocardioides szechwanensis]|uniref:DNA-binding transcriptional regulator, MarR family n=1 Tax=Nocardioides szechwanensis TaxID=1005944 RepID=A0A1G9Z6T9_9ACTN|nr:MarR family transcriptional regulator [Nocardioides szechwanensis]GEP33839.1 MarR family transcriptional regulator [Nocardioides szechwanensis]SDN17129.1 DNA-binding transcriptional regulator, MarR family [Nocardioides szechwanensis]